MAASEVESFEIETLDGAAEEEDENDGVPLLSHAAERLSWSNLRWTKREVSVLLIAVVFVVPILLLALRGDMSATAHYPIQNRPSLSSHRNGSPPAEVCKRIVPSLTNWTEIGDSSSSSSSSWTKQLVEKVVQTVDRCKEPAKKRRRLLRECSCPDPTKPVPGRYSSWMTAFQRNQQVLRGELERLQSRHRPVVDVIMMGDSLTEHWLGTDLGRNYDAWQGNLAVYEELFRSSDSSSSAANRTCTGLAVGIGGDRCANLLYRLQNGEGDLIVRLRPAVVWILIGINDWLGERCNGETMFTGIVAVVEDLLERNERSSARVVINSLLPVPGRRNNAGGSAWQPTEQIRLTNDLLACYASQTEGVEFFNATDIFLTTTGNDVNQSLYAPDRLHLNAAGQRVWGKAIIEEVLKIKKEQS